MMNIQRPLTVIVRISVLLCLLVSSPQLVKAVFLYPSVSGTVIKHVAISGVNAISFGSLSTSSNNQQIESFCVASNDGVTGAYKITFMGSGTASAFTLVHASDPTETLGYIVEFNDQDNNTGYATVTSGLALTSQTAGSVNFACPSNNARVRVSISSAAASAADPGSYSGTLTIVVAENA